MLPNQESGKKRTSARHQALSSSSSIEPPQKSLKKSSEQYENKILKDINKCKLNIEALKELHQMNTDGKIYRKIFDILARAATTRAIGDLNSEPFLEQLKKLATEEGFLPFFNSNANNEERKSLLMFAASFGFKNTVDWLLTLQENPGLVADQDGQTALYWVIESTLCTDAPEKAIEIITTLINDAKNRHYQWDDMQFCLDRATELNVNSQYSGIIKLLTESLPPASPALTVPLELENPKDLLDKPLGEGWKNPSPVGMDASIIIGNKKIKVGAPVLSLIPASTPLPVPASSAVRPFKQNAAPLIDLTDPTIDLTAASQPTRQLLPLPAKPSGVVRLCVYDADGVCINCGRTPASVRGFNIGQTSSSSSSSAINTSSSFFGGSEAAILKIERFFRECFQERKKYLEIRNRSSFNPTDDASLFQAENVFVRFNVVWSHIRGFIENNKKDEAQIRRLVTRFSQINELNAVKIPSVSHVTLQNYFLKADLYSIDSLMQFLGGFYSESENHGMRYIVSEYSCGRELFDHYQAYNKERKIFVDEDRYIYKQLLVIIEERVERLQKKLGKEKQLAHPDPWLTKLEAAIKCNQAILNPDDEVEILETPPPRP